MKQFTKRCLFGIFVGLLLTWFGLIVLMPAPNLKTRPSALHSDMRVIRKALFHYKSEHGHFPYDDRGPHYALYKLKPYFDVLPSIMPEFAWCVDEERVNVADAVLYWNLRTCYDNANGRLEDDCFIICIQTPDQSSLCITRDGRIITVEQPMYYRHCHPME